MTEEEKLAEEVAAVLGGKPCETCTDYDTACEFMSNSGGTWEQCDKWKDWNEKMKRWKSRVQAEDIKVGLEEVAKACRAGTITVREAASELGTLFTSSFRSTQDDY